MDTARVQMSIGNPIGGSFKLVGGAAADVRRAAQQP